jgi:hypothetical protein
MTFVGRLTAATGSGAPTRTVTDGFFELFTDLDLGGDFLAGLPAEDFFVLVFPGMCAVFLPMKKAGIHNTAPRL